jgi:hypothetical protein
VFGLGLIGALVFYLQQAHGFWGVIVAILPSLSGLLRRRYG